MHGLIPAWAGKTERRGRPESGRPAHPRVGGENLRLPFYGPQRLGSSPRGRGKRRRRLRARPDRRLIPAWAGKTCSCARRKATGEAHPRVGGENPDQCLPRDTRTGSSPRGRGKQGGLAFLLGDVGLIPAWAGKTHARVRGATGDWAHPRVGGENDKYGLKDNPELGSSPRGRGKPLTAILPRGTVGLIPAWAGKTLSDLRFYRADRSDLGNP